MAQSAPAAAQSAAEEKARIEREQLAAARDLTKAERELEVARLQTAKFQTSNFRISDLRLPDFRLQTSDYQTSDCQISDFRVQNIRLQIVRFQICLIQSLCGGLDVCPLPPGSLCPEGFFLGSRTPHGGTGCLLGNVMGISPCGLVHKFHEEIF